MAYSNLRHDPSCPHQLDTFVPLYVGDLRIDEEPNCLSGANLKGFDSIAAAALVC